MSEKLAGKRLAVLGTGKLGGILLRAYLKKGLFDAARVTATVKHAEKAAALAKELGVAVTTDNRKAVHGADIVLLGVKPQVVGEVFRLLRRLAESGVAVLMVEQNAKAALKASDRGYVLAEGRNRIAGRSADLLNDPAVAETFLGGRRAA